MISTQLDVVRMCGSSLFIASVFFQVKGNRARREGSVDGLERKTYKVTL